MRGLVGLGGNTRTLSTGKGVCQNFTVPYIVGGVELRSVIPLYVSYNSY